MSKIAMAVTGPGPWFTIETVKYRGIVQWFTCINRRLEAAGAVR